MDNGYAIYLSYNNQEEGFPIPVLPGEISITNEGNTTKYEISGGGEINVIKSPALAEYKFSSIFPVGDLPFTTDLVFEPSYYVDLILKWMETKRPIRFVFTGMSFDINEAVSIESFEWKEVAGSPGLIEYDLELKQYLFYRAQKVVVKKTSSSTAKKTTKKKASRPTDKQNPKTYKLKPGDTLAKVAKQFLGNSGRWKEIQKLNGIKDSELKSMKVGRVLKIPS
ncbi:peptidoglycan-binding protein LysM [Paenibacillus amylolyticus]|uniref:LysM peptidoglycan-binding domain-containing protein n=1 Tax=Paenibacillus amylolyticus TaxID=1451 RepID=UPI00096CCDF6|nr:LysM peptidoglycan-binding domain-containing protein [Paenibacillus amylolyticus]OMF05273.1 peptidoglycan-binding protein LysM [Paenibacillus amylolyticus]